MGQGRFDPAGQESSVRACAARGCVWRKQDPSVKTRSEFHESCIYITALRRTQSFRSGCVRICDGATCEEELGGDVAALAAASKCPWAFFPAGDPNSGGDGDMYDAAGRIFRALEDKFKGKNVTKRYASMRHGWVTRGAIKEGLFNAGSGEDVQAAVNECVTDIFEFFVRCGLMRRTQAGLPPPPIKLKRPVFVKVVTIEPEVVDVSRTCEERGVLARTRRALGVTMTTSRAGPRSWGRVPASSDGRVCANGSKRRAGSAAALADLASARSGVHHLHVFGMYPMKHAQA